MRLILLLSLPVITLSVPPECDNSKVRDEAQRCVDTIQPLITKILMMKNINSVDPETASEVNWLCDVGVECFQTLQYCTKIQANLISTLEGACDMFTFTTSDGFRDCSTKIARTNTNSCVKEYFNNPGYPTLAGMKQRCDKFKDGGDCVEKAVKNTCSSEDAKKFKRQNDSQRKKYQC